MGVPRFLCQILKMPILSVLVAICCPCSVSNLRHVYVACHNSLYGPSRCEGSMSYVEFKDVCVVLSLKFCVVCQFFEKASSLGRCYRSTPILCEIVFLKLTYHFSYNPTYLEFQVGRGISIFDIILNV